MLSYKLLLSLQEVIKLLNAFVLYHAVTNFTRDVHTTIAANIL